MKLDGINIKIEKTNRKKTLSIFIERNGSVKVLAPNSVTDEKIEAGIRASEYQIFTKLAKWKELNMGKVKRQLVNGQSYLYLGRNYRLSLVDDSDVALKISSGRLLFNKKYIPQAEKVFRDFYREKALQKIEERMQLITSKFSIKPL